MSVTLFRQNCFFLTVPNHFVDETFCVSETFGYQKCLCPARENPPFSIEILMSHSTEKLRRGTHLCFTEKFVSKDFMNKRGKGVNVTILVKIVFVSQYQIISYRKPSVFQKVSGIGNVYA